MMPVSRFRLFLNMVAVLLVVLSLLAAHAQTGSDAPAFIASTWKMTTAGRIDLDSVQYFRVSVADGSQTLLAYQPDERLGFFSPDRQKALVYGAWSDFGGQIASLHDGSIQSYHFDSYTGSPQVWSPDSRYLTAVVYSNCGCEGWPRSADLGVIDVETGDLRVLTDGEHLSYEYGAVAWSPDGTQLAYLNQQPNSASPGFTDSIRVVPVDGSQPPRTLFTFADPDDGEVGILLPVLRWLQDGKHLALNAYTGLTTDVWFFDVERGGVSFHYASSQTFDVCWATTTNHFIAMFDSYFTLITPDGVPPLDLSFVNPAIWQQRPASTVPCTWSPDGEKISLADSSDYRLPPVVRVIDLKARQVSEIQVDPGSGTLKLYWSPDSPYLAVMVYDTGLDPNDVYIYDTTTMEQVLARKSLDFITWIPSPAAGAQNG
jgi:WD40 repeat protein